MKRDGLNGAFALVLLLLSTVCTMPAGATTFVSNGLKYWATDPSVREVLVDGYDGDCPSVVTIPDVVIYENEEYVVTGVSQFAFKWCSNLTEINFPAGLTSIGYQAFMGCDGLKEILRVVINVLTNLKRFHRPVSSSLSI